MGALVAHWCIDRALIDRALLDRAILQLDRTLDRALIYAENLRLYMQCACMLFRYINRV